MLLLNRCIELMFISRALFHTGIPSERVVKIARINSIIGQTTINVILKGLFTGSMYIFDIDLEAILI